MLISVEIGRKNVGSARLLVGKEMFFPWQLAVLGLLPPSKPLAAGETGSPLGCTTDIGKAITIHITEAGVM